MVLLLAGAVVFIAFSDFGSKEPVINGMGVRRYVVTFGLGPSLAELGPDAIPWLIKGLDAKDSALHTAKVRVWKLLPGNCRPNGGTAHQWILGGCMSLA